MKRRCTGGRPASVNSNVVGVVLKAPRIHSAAECHTALMGHRPTSRGEKIEAIEESGAKDKLDEVADILGAEALGWL